MKRHVVVPDVVVGQVEGVGDLVHVVVDPVKSLG